MPCVCLRFIKKFKWYIFFTFFYDLHEIIKKINFYLDLKSKSNFYMNFLFQILKRF